MCHRHSKQSLLTSTSDNKDIALWERFRIVRNIPRFSIIWIIGFDSSLNGFYGRLLRKISNKCIFVWMMLDLHKLYVDGDLRVDLPGIPQDNFWWQTRWWMIPLIQNLFSFGIYHFFKTVDWNGVMKDDSIGSSLPECQSFVLKTFDLVLVHFPIYCVLVHFPSGSVRYLSWFCHVTRLILSWFTHRIHDCEEYRWSSFFRIFSSCNQTWLDNRMTAMRSIHGINVFNPIELDFHIVLQWRINFVSSRVALNGAHV